ncbi:hypothetical protein BC938DRAFT_482512 [Jimgerdemannia flammicorona]|uniref:RRM domain-containing protein n=1 Tax=Jimgerdemannia flammicorona TaxID=994334 RepID=A0A433QDU7_9FUNG|nr:hypothetical protein BC938DRAFT_482512 [Jimgerdemannia flammicorona]
MDKQRKNRNSPYSRPTEGQWSHDMFDDRNSRDQNRRATGDVMSRLGGSSRADRNSAGTNNKLIVENLFYEVTQIDVQELFEQVGPVRRTFLQFDRSGRSTGVAEVTFENPEDAARALKTYNNLDLDNQPMRIKFAPLTSNPSSAHQSHGGGRNGTASGSIFSRLGPTANSRSGGSTYVRKISVLLGYVLRCPLRLLLEKSLRLHLRSVNVSSLGVFFYFYVWQTNWRWIDKARRETSLVEGVGRGALWCRAQYRGGRS